LLVQARQASIIDVFAAAPVSGVSDEQFAGWVVGCCRDDILSAEYHCEADFIATEPVAGAFSSPLVTHVELTRACNLRCRHCHQHLHLERLLQ